MEEAGGVKDFKVGQLAEMRTFEDGFRSAWFRCKVIDIQLEENKIFLDYNVDFESEEPSWVKIYQTPPYDRKSKHIKELLMVRPPYPEMHQKDNMPPVSSISATCVVIDGTWKVGNLVDWFQDDCYWSARIIKVLGDDKVQIQLPMFPVGQREEREGGKHEALCKDLRPTLDWSETKGWTFLVEEGHTPCDAHLVFPTKQGTDVEVEHAVTVNASSTTLIPAEGDRDRDSEKNEDVEVEHAVAEGDRDSEKNEDVAVEHAVAVVNASSATDIPAEGDKDSEQNENEKLDCGLVGSSESVSSLRVEKRKAPEPEAAAADEEVEAPAAAAGEEVEKQELNIMRKHTVEASMLDLEGLVNKVKWMQTSTCYNYIILEVCLRG